MSKKDQKKKLEDLINPIDEDKVTDIPHLLPYAHHVGSVAIKPEDKGKLKGRAVTAMRQQTHRQYNQLYEQMQTLVNQAKELQRRVEISEIIYEADMNFDPIIGNTYYVYQREDESYVLSLIAPHEWGRSKPFKSFIAAATMLSDHTWEVINEKDETA